MIFGVLVIFLAVFADQLAKYFVDANIVSGQPVEVFSLFNLVKVWNTGVSFSMFSHYGKVGAIVLSVLAIAVCLFLLHWMIKEKNMLKVVSLGLIIGGAIGNVIDRVRFGAVLDFLDFHIMDYHWPAFNLADSFICIGAGVLIIWEIFYKQKERI